MVLNFWPKKTKGPAPSLRGAVIFALLISCCMIGFWFLVELKRVP